MKKVLAVTLVLVCLLPSVSLAVGSGIDWSKYSAEQKQAAYEELTLLLEGTDVAASQYQTLTVGSKGDDVVRLKQRMYELGYFKSQSDNPSYTTTTADYVKEFQKANSLVVDGIASPEMQELFFSADAKPKPGPTPDPKKAYAALNFKDIARYPDKYDGEKIRITGRVVQVMGSRDTGYDLRVATKGRYDDVVYLTMFGDPGFGILEEDKIVAYAIADGDYTYKTIMGASVTLPSFIVDSIELK